MSVPVATVQPRMAYVQGVGAGSAVAGAKKFVADGSMQPSTSYAHVDESCEVAVAE